ncbi:hypothetical protein [Cupriavidus sp. UYPR2.512]|nr:hypothetical protein [Cupriavidus sp. UYPR2.512]
MFEYLSTNHEINRFVFTVLIGWCVWEALLVLYKGARTRKRR